VACARRSYSCVRRNSAMLEDEFLPVLYVRRRKAASGAASPACGAGGAASGAIQGKGG
ncbi:hypothetical protein A2U01_0095626, partial [Trifolium medium]|nr:hypothetical protein [Trifolium medium]